MKRKLPKPEPPARLEWRQNHTVCMLCGFESRTGFGLECHEMVSGPGRAAALTVPATWLRLCGDCINGCHELLQGTEPAVGLALKQIADPENYDRVAVNRLRGRADDAVTEAEVAWAGAYLEWSRHDLRPLTRKQAGEVVAGAIEVARGEA